ncbi:MAG TPA: DMT family transporter [Anaeromyxobacteraceae bacterium]|nr:DMT family transporter [Anaeromyxobacteraceae bacterium]
MTAAASRRRAVARLELAGAALAFALMAVLGRRLSREYGFTAGHLSVIRFAIGAAVSLAAFGIWSGLYRPARTGLLVSRGISGGLVVILYFAALARVPAGEAGLIYNLFPVIATGMSFFTFGERPTMHLVAGLALATAGVALVLGGGGLSGAFEVGHLAALGAAVFAATSANVIRAMRGTVNAPTIFFWFCIAGLPVVLPFALDPWPRAIDGWSIACVMGLLSFVAQVLMTEAYGALSVAEAASWLQLTPLVQYLVAVPLLGEPVTPIGLVGIVAGVVGVAWATVLGRRPAVAASTPAPPIPHDE